MGGDSNAADKNTGLMTDPDFVKSTDWSWTLRRFSCNIFLQYVSYFHT